MPQSCYYTVSDNCRIHYLRMGNGPRLVLGFHGYGNEAALFHFLHDPAYTVLSIDLPFHGQSDWQAPLLMDKPLLQTMVQQLMEEYQATRISLAGYSMGGRVCLVLCELMADRIDRVVLLAPDGLRFNYFYHFLTHTRLGRFLFHDFTRRSNSYKYYLSWLGKLGIVGKSKFKFAMQQISNPEAVLLLNRTWLSTQHLIPDDLKLAAALRHYKPDIRIIMGRYDKIIPLKLATQFCKAHPEVQVQVTVVDRGHVLCDYKEVQETVCHYLFHSGTGT